MKIYIDFSKQAITKIDSDVAYVGDVYSNVFELLFFNYGDNADWFPTMSQLAPNGREAGDFSADALEENETYDYVENDVTYKHYTFTIGDGWVKMKGRSNFFIWVNKLVDSNVLQRKCYGKLNVALNESTDNYFIQDAYLNPKVKEYIDNTIGDDFETYKSTIDDEVESQNETIASLIQASPSVFDTASNITALTENKGVAVATDTGHIYYWDSTLATPAYVSSGLVYNEPEIADGSIAINKLKFTTTASNLFDKEDLVLGKYVYYLTGKEGTNANFCYTKTLIPITPDTTIYFNQPTIQICFYDENQTFIGNPTWSNNVYNVLSPSNARYIRVSIETSLIEDYQVTMNSLPNEYKNGKVISRAFIENPYIDVEYGKINHFDKNATVDGYFIYFSTGRISASSTFFYSDYIDIENSSVLSFANITNNIIQICFYNANKEFISGIISTFVINSSNTPANSKYIRFSAPIVNKDTLMLVDGDFSNRTIDYTGFKTISESLIPKGNNETITRTKIEITSSDTNTTFVEKMVTAYNKGCCDVYIDGVFDFSTPDVISNTYSQGLPIGKNNRYYFMAQSKIICNYLGSDTNIQDNFSVFHNHVSYGSFEMYGLNIECYNIRYCIHDECGHETRFDSYIHKYSGCNMKLDNSNHPNKNTYFHCIGGGLGYDGVIIIQDCYFNSVYVPTTNASDVQYHGNWANNSNTQNGYCKLYVTSCYFEHTMSVSAPNYETQKKYLLFTNNSCSSSLIYNGTSTTYWEVKSWNNEIRG